MSQTLQQLSMNSLAFPPIHNALTEPNGLLAFGGDLSVERLRNAYTHGIFPWYSDQDPIMWWSPTPRAIINTSTIKINKTLKKFLKKSPFQVTINTAFEDVIAYCADAPFRNDETWIVDDMMHAYTQLHQNGYAHSIEVWEKDELVGGLYGVAINGYFSGESMFYRSSNASKVALIYLAEHLRSIKITLIDCQITNPFLEDMGCYEVPRSDFINQQQTQLSIIPPTDFWQPKRLR